MTRYIGIAGGLGLLLAVLALTNATPAQGQSPFKPTQALIVNDSANPVPVTVVGGSANPVSVTVVAPPPQTVVTCTGEVDLIPSLPVFTQTANAPDSRFVCSGGATSLDVSRIVYTPDLAGERAVEVTQFRVTVTHRNDTGAATGEILAVSTDGAPYADVVRPFRFDSTSGGQFVNVMWASSGIAGTQRPRIAGTLVLIGTPVQ